LIAAIANSHGLPFAEPHKRFKRALCADNRIYVNSGLCARANGPAGCANTVEEIHRSIARMPLEVFARWALAHSPV